MIRGVRRHISFTTSRYPESQIPRHYQIPRFPRFSNPATHYVHSHDDVHDQLRRSWVHMARRGQQLPRAFNHSSDSRKQSTGTHEGTLGDAWRRVGKIHGTAFLLLQIHSDCAVVMIAGSVQDQRHSQLLSLGKTPGTYHSDKGNTCCGLI